MLYLTLLVPALFAVLHTKTGKYPLSASVTLSCLVISLLVRSSLLIPAAYALSVVGDYFMAHSGGKNGDRMLLCGIVGFFLAHACFLIYALRTAAVTSVWPLWTILSALLAVGYAVFLVKTLYPAIDERFLRIAATAYTGISLCVMTASLFSAHPPLPKLLFSAGIAFILFSDTLIALSRFLGRKKVGRWICPTYFACHILIAASQIALRKFLG
jgi:uncharacterized membrane protein YhhN